MSSAENQQRGIAFMVVIGIEEALLLRTVYRVISHIQIQDDLLGGIPHLLDKQVH